MENKFKQWLIDNYEQNTLADMANHGCTGGIGGLIYYKETFALYQEFSASLHETMQAYKEETGEWPQYVIEELGDDIRFANALVWFAAEYLANELTHGIYEDEIS